MPTRLKEEFSNEGTELTAIPLTPDSRFLSEDLTRALYEPGFTKLIIAG
ncbi:hypothetical protein QUF90_00955 [Desulfococcaceae bacterium HSG9]|nr:hypothetical protein [Desulfococcaceae bacterium HSG9]